MAKARKPKLLTRIREAALPAASILVVAFFAVSALFGSNGALAWGEYSRKIDERRVQLAELEQQRAELAHRVKLLDPKKVDPDLADELVRREMGVAHPDEIVVPLK